MGTVLNRTGTAPGPEPPESGSCWGKYSGTDDCPGEPLVSFPLPVQPSPAVLLSASAPLFLLRVLGAGFKVGERCGKELSGRQDSGWVTLQIIRVGLSRFLGVDQGLDSVPLSGCAQQGRLFGGIVSVPLSSPPVPGLFSPSKNTDRPDVYSSTRPFFLP